jgi:hypothetical protein
MKSVNIIMVLLVIIFNFSFAQNIPLHITGIRGVEDNYGNTHLFYKIYERIDSPPYFSFTDNSVYHFDFNSQTDSLFIEAKGGDLSANIWIDDYKIILLNPLHYLYTGTVWGIECSPMAFNSLQGNIYLNLYLQRGSGGKGFHSKNRGCINTLQ